MGKENLIANAKKGVYALFSTRAGQSDHQRLSVYRRDLRQIHYRNDAGFSEHSGVVLCGTFDSANAPYAILISVVVGVTNFIPFFGPYLGAIPSAVLIFMVNPIQALYFIIFIFVLQQIDGNFIAPRILGDSTGMSSLMVLVAIMVGGGLFGIPGHADRRSGLRGTVYGGETLHGTPSGG